MRALQKPPVTGRLFIFESEPLEHCRHAHLTMHKNLFQGGGVLGYGTPHSKPYKAILAYFRL